MISDLWWGIAALLVTFDVVAIFTLIFFERRDPESVLAWLFAVITLPVVGFVLYLIFGFKYFKQRAFGLKSTEDRAILGRVRHGLEPGLPDETERNLGVVTEYPDLVRLLWTDSGAFLTTGNELTVYTDGRAKFDALLEAIHGARSHVHLEYYLLRDDGIGQRLLVALKAKAHEGVEVRILYDDLGNQIPRQRYRELREAGGHTSGFYRALLPSIGFRINYRNHRKIAVIDGTVGFIGGFNVGDDYLGLGPLGPWRDSAVRIRGGGVRALQLRFLLDWKFATKERLALQGQYFPPAPHSGTAAVQIVSGGPDTTWNPPREQYVKMVSGARRTCYLQTPYFIPDVSVMTALRIAALSGVDVRIMVPTRPDLPIVHWATLSYVGELLEAGVRVFSYDAGFLHAKTVTVDDAVTSIGSANWDLRSFKWNFESNAVIYDHAFADQYRGIFEEDMRRSTEITRASYATRSRRTRFKESTCRLFSGAL